MPEKNIRLAWRTFDDLSGRQMHDLLALRQDIFILEQRCLYRDIDGIDPVCRHLLGWSDAGRLVACLRLIPPGVLHALPAIGRVAVRSDARGRGIARAMLLEAIAAAGAIHPGWGVAVHAQVYLQRFYESLGFRPAGEPYDDDGIPHLEMIRAPRDPDERSRQD